MSSRSIEGENPLYLTQAKVYDGSAAVGPCVFVPENAFDPEQEIQLEILRDGSPIFQESIRISQMKRSFEELVHYLFRECSFPEGCLLMTGTGIIPPPDFSLRSGDHIHITLDAIGTLKNKVA
jgi:2-dehydro-3-deoxy-D-arabinonate dehydratase